jgi:hypothetical protein
VAVSARPLSAMPVNDGNIDVGCRAVRYSAIASRTTDATGVRARLAYSCRSRSRGSGTKIVVLFI